MPWTQWNPRSWLPGGTADCEPLGEFHEIFGAEGFEQESVGAGFLYARPDRQDGKASVLILSLNSAKWEESREQAKMLETICERHDAVATLIFSSTVHESVVELYLQGLGSRVGLAIDRFVPEGDYQLSDATFIAYGYRRSLSVFVISSDGMVTHAMRDLEGLDAALGQ